MIQDPEVLKRFFDHVQITQPKYIAQSNQFCALILAAAKGLITITEDENGKFWTHIEK